MMRRETLSVRPLTLATFVIGIALNLVAGEVAQAAQTEDPHVRQAISDGLRHMEAMLADGSSAEAIADDCCSKDLIIVAEGGATASRDRATFITGLAADLKTLGRPCSLALAGSVVSSGDVAAAFVNMRCKGIAGDAPDVTSRILFVWRKEGGKWKAIREMAGGGTL